MADGKNTGTVVRFSMRVSGGSLPDGYSATIAVDMDFANMDAHTVYEIASRALRIDLQRVLRGKPVEYLDGLTKTGLKIHASAAGQNVLTMAEKADKLATQLNIDPELARKILENPTMLDQLK